MNNPSGKLAVMLGAFAAPSIVGAFGLGEARVESSFGQPLEVRIPLNLERDEALSRLRVDFAAPADYVEAGLEWPVILAKTAISLEQGAGGAYIRIHSDQRVMEPILPLLLQARLGPTSIRREYSVLLDLPAAYARAQVTQRAQPAPAPAPVPAPTVAVVAPSIPNPSAVTTQPRAASAPAIAGKPAAKPAAPTQIIATTRVLDGESLGTLAQRVRPDPRINLRRMMKAIYAANPDAFDGSEDRLWSGREIKVPAVGEFRTPRPEPLHARLTLSAHAPAAWTLPRIPGRPALKLTPTMQWSGALPVTAANVALRMTDTLAAAPVTTPIVASAAPAPAAPAPQAAVPALQMSTETSAPLSPAGPARRTGLGYWALALLALLGYGAFRLFGSRFEGSGLKAVWEEWRERRASAEEGADSKAEANAEAATEPAVARPAQASQRPVEISPPQPQAAERLMSVTPPETVAYTPPPAAAAPAPSTPAPQSPPTPAKIVPIKRRDDHAIEVVEAPTHAATGTDGGLNGFYADVAQMLTSALQKDPRRRDLRLKLLEVYFSAGLADEYLSQARAYLEEVKGQNDESWHDVPDMGRKLVPGHEWFAMSTPPRLSSAGDAPGKAAPAQKRTFNRYYEGVDQWRLRGALEDLTQQYQILARDPAFAQMQTELLQKLAGRPTLLVHAAGLSQRVGGAQIFMKREPRHGSGDDHLINAIGQCALAKRMGRRGVVAATSNGLHGLAVAAVAQWLGLECRLYMDDKDMRSHFARVLRIRELGAKVDDVHDNPSLPGEYDVRRAALTAWLERPKELLYISSLSSGPHPYPMIMQNCQSVVGRETRAQLHVHSERPPAAVVAGTADGPGVIGLLHSFLEDTQTRLYCVESSRISNVRDRMTLRNEGPDLEMTEHNWPREHNWLRETRRVTYAKIPEPEAIQAMQVAYETEKMMLSQQGAQVVAYAMRVAKELRPDQTVTLMLPSQNDADARLMENANQRQIRIDVG